MSSVVYNGKIVGSCVSDIKKLINNFDTLSGSVKTATNKIISARGFNEYIGGISSDSFSGPVQECGKAVNELVNTIRQKEITILAYNKDEKAINTFLDSLSNQDYNSLDLSALDQYISFGRKASNFFRGVGSSLATAGLGLVEGIMDFGETGADLVRLGGTALASIFTSTYDLLSGDDLTNRMWEDTKAKVSEKKVENIFNSFYANNEIGQSIKENAYLFDGVRGVSKGLGYTGGLIGVNVFTGGLASGLGIGAAGSIGAGQLAATAGVMGFANGTEEAWADGATTGKGLLYGAAAGAWEGAQWFAGAKINQYGGLGDRIASGIFKGATSGVATRIAMDTVDSGLEGFVQPALTMIYKDYGGNSFAENYHKAFEAAGGWQNVGTQALMGGIASAIGEFSGARKLLKEEKKAAGASEIFAGKGDMSDEETIAALTTVLGGDEEAARRIFAARTTGDFGGMGADGLLGDAASGPQAPGIQGADYSRSSKYTVDGKPIKTADHLFNTKTSGTIPSEYKWFMDGSYIPDTSSGATRGLFSQYETYYKPSELIQIIDAHRDNMTGQQYTALMKAAGIFQSANAPVSANALKLIVNHSEGNVGRIKSALGMAYGKASDSQIDDLATKLAKELFPSSTSTSGILSRSVMDQYIDGLRSSGQDTWKSHARLLTDMNPEELIRLTAGESSESLLKKTSSYFGGQLSNETMRKIIACDGYPASIKKILLEDGTVPEYMVDMLSAGGAAKIFNNANLSRLKATTEVMNLNFDTATRLVSNASTDFDRYSDLLKATHLFESYYGTRKTYYHIVDTLMDAGASLNDAVTQARLMNLNAMTGVGMDSEVIKKYSARVFSSNANGRMYLWNDDVVDHFDNSGGSVYASSYMKKHYMKVDGQLDMDGLVNDFSTMMNNKIRTMDATAVSLMGGDLANSKKATELFMNSYLNAAKDVNNPNRGEALKFMSKMLELESQGKGVSIFCDYGKTGSWCSWDGKKINLSLTTVDGNLAGVALHENGHCIFDKTLDAKPPSDFDAVRRRATSNLSSANSQALLKKYGQNIIEVEAYCDYLADKEFLQEMRKAGFSSLEDYKKYLVQQYSQVDIGSRSSSLGHNSSRVGLYTRDGYNQGVGKKLDFKDVDAMAEYHIRSMRQKISDRIYRTQFADYEVTSGIIDSTTLGRRRYQYGHGPSYFDGTTDYANRMSYTELVADYSYMKVSGNNRAIRFLRAVLGDELIDMVDRTYQTMLS